MKINSHTKISTLIKHNKGAIDAIASLNVHFNKLKNPILRAVLAPRVTIADASRIGKCAIADFFNKLKEIGFEIDPEENYTSSANQSKDEVQTAESLEKFLDNRSCESLDVRQMITDNDDPFNLIMSKAKKLETNQAIEIINSFEPIPLIRILQYKGFACRMIQEGEIYRTYIKKGTSEISDSTEDSILCTKEEFDSFQQNFQGKIKTIDVRGLEMPLPMVTILQELEDLQSDNALFVQHKKIPQYLLPELTARGCKTVIYVIEEGNVQLLIHK